MLVKNAIKPLILLSIYTSILCLYFWTTSRYPELSAKAVIGNNSPLANLGFSPVITVNESFSFWEKVFAETINWIDTNKKGMSFSFLMGACFLSLLPLVRRKQFKSGFANSLLGMGLGAPLGVCVNCAAPIARALHAAGSSLQTSLSALIASPTLNVVVLVMAFSMFPLYLVTIKLLLTLFFILLIIPLSCHYLFQKETSAQNIAESCEIENFVDQALTDKQETWSGAAIWFIHAYLRNFLYLLKIALPLMFLAGFMGSIFTVITPWSDIQSISDNITMPIMIVLMLALSIFGALLPSPMAFDIILSSVLLQAGVPIQYVAVFLFTLGSFSIYAFFIIWRSVSLRLAGFLLLTSASLGFLTGVLSLYFESMTVSQAYQHTEQSIDLKENPLPDKSNIVPNENNQFDPILQRTDKAHSFDKLKPLIDGNKVIFQPVPTDLIEAKPENIKVKWSENKSQIQPKGDKPFSEIIGETLGIEQPYSISYITGLSDHVARNTMSVAVADVHNDGWPDILLMGDHEVRPNLILYANIGGKKFIRQALPMPEGMQEAITVALVDLNGDGWSDIVFSTFGGENFVIYNKNGSFSKENLTPLSTHNGTAMSMSFADIDLDGDLDIFMGNWSVGPTFIDTQNSQNWLLTQEEGGVFTQSELPGLNAETLTSLFSDFNQDGYPDLYIGNDFLLGDHSDLILLNNGNGAFSIPDKDTIEGFLGTQTTMSIDQGDIDNDLRPDYYIGQIAYTGQFMRSMSKIADKQIAYSDYCENNEEDTQKDNCNSEINLKSSLSKASNYISDACNGLTDPINKAKCLRHMLGYKYFCDTRNMFSNPRHYKNKASERYNSFCHGMGDAEKNTQETYDFTGHLNTSNESLHNALLRNSSEGGRISFVEKANELGVGYGAWTWNARFADLDNDGWQDLYVVNGYNLPMTLSTNIFYRNTGDGQFEDATEKFGLENYTPASAYSYTDLDNDGDLDIITVQNDAPVSVYMNEAKNRSIEFSLIDKTSLNTHAVGAQIIISHTYTQHERPERVMVMRQMRIIKSSGGFRSYNQPIAHFGLSETNSVSEIKIIWPDGKKDIMRGTFKSGQQYQIIRMPEPETTTRVNK